MAVAVVVAVAMHQQMYDLARLQQLKEMPVALDPVAAEEVNDH